MRTYSPADVIVNIGGIRLSNFADGSFVTAERNGQAFTISPGADGKIARVRNADRSGKVTVRLHQTSPSNDLLSALAAIDEQSGEGVGELLIKDMNGTTLIQAQNAWIQKLPSVEFGKDASDREWVFDCDELDMAVGGATNVVTT